MPAAELKRRWQAGETTYGAVVRLGLSWTAEVFAHAGLDFVWLDLQHSLTSDTTLIPMLQATNGSGATTLARVPAGDPWIIGRTLDAGAEGVIVPMIETREAAEQAVAACRFSPEGIRSFSSFRTKLLPGGPMRKALCLVMIETQEGVDNVEEIARVDGVDGVFIGPSDLALSLGLEPSATIQPGPHSDAVDRIRLACDRAGIVTMITGAPTEMRERGFRAISLGSDDGFFLSGFRAVLEARNLDGSAS
ncbi:HpcH/HpaI aldolase family protein [Jatrophihabitans sp. DSM 45814]